jgi:hypothetical protein
VIPAAVLVLLSHAQGIHERVSLVVSQKAVDGLLVIDIDSGERAKLIRAGADFNHDGVISTEERPALQRKLVQLATQGLKLGISGYSLSVKVADVKMSTRDDHTVSETGLSLAVMLEATVKSPIGEGMKLEIEAESGDKSHVLVEVSATSGEDGGVEAVGRKELLPSERWTVRLGALGAR